MTNDEIRLRILELFSDNQGHQIAHLWTDPDLAQENRIRVERIFRGMKDAGDLWEGGKTRGMVYTIAADGWTKLHRLSGAR
jgi:hypothetical protein